MSAYLTEQRNMHGTLLLRGHLKAGHSITAVHKGLRITHQPAEINKGAGNWLHIPRQAGQHLLVLLPEIMDYYERGGERDRLAGGPGRLEFLRTWDVLTRVLPSPPAAVLDVGGATGVYAEPLAEAGYQVEVVDPVPGHVAEASARPGVTAVLGDARALPSASSSVDAVLLLGPLYHLQERADRIAAWRECGRVVRPGGVIVAATINRFASLFDGFVKEYFRDPRFRPLVERALADGVHQNVDSDRAWFTTAYFHHPDEIVTEVTDAGLVVERRISVESPLWMTGPRLDEILADTSLLLDMLRRVEGEPSLLGAGSHILTVARPAPASSNLSAEVPSPAP